MAVFDDNYSQQLDWTLLQNGSITLYYRSEYLAEDIEQLKEQGYWINSFDCSDWQNEAEFLKILGDDLGFPGWYGQNLDAFNDCLSDIEIPQDSGRVLVFYAYDFIAKRAPKFAWHILDILEINSRLCLLFGKRLITLIQTNNPEILFEPVGAKPVNWNRKEWLRKNRNLS